MDKKNKRPMHEWVWHSGIVISFTYGITWTLLHYLQRREFSFVGIVIIPFLLLMSYHISKYVKKINEK